MAIVLPEAEGPSHCKWCKRSFADTPHPKPSVLKKDPDRKLPRRAPRSAECANCPHFFAQVYPKADASSTSRQDLLRQLEEGSCHQASYNENLSKWEGRARANRKRELGSDSGEDVEKPHKHEG